MAKVLQDKVTNWIGEMVCTDCSSEIQYCETDVYASTWEDSPTTYHLDCPACAACITPRAAPAWVKRRAAGRKYKK